MRVFVNKSDFDHTSPEIAFTIAIVYNEKVAIVFDRNIYRLILSFI